MNEFGWAIIGPGAIAHKFAQALRHIEGGSLVRVQGRDLARASAFADQYCGHTEAHPHPCATTSLEVLLADSSVNAVYIATPHAFHAEAIRRCLLAGKSVLCEKPMVTDAATAEALISLSRERRVFLMEAVWTRFLPIYDDIGQWLRGGTIGQVRALQSSFGFNAPVNPRSRLFDAAQAGGALLDIGVYNLTMTRWVMQMAQGACPPVTKIEADGVIGDTGVDLRTAATLHFPEGITSQFVATVQSAANDEFQIFGEHGTITIHHHFWAATRATLARSNEAPITVERMHRINGFEGEIEEAMRCIQNGKIESELISHADTRETLMWMDAIRRQIGLRYPFE